MSFWTTNPITAANLDKLGPLVDGIVGTYGEYQDLYEAMIDPAGPQWKKVIVTDGCILSQDVTIPSASYQGCIIGFGRKQITLGGSKKLRIEASDFLLRNIKISNAVGNALEIAEDRCWIDEIGILYAGGIGVWFDSSLGGDLHRITNSVIYDCGDDGIEIDDSVNVSVFGTRIQACSGWGIDDNNSTALNSTFVGNILNGNSLGGLSSNSTLIAANRT